MTDRAPDPTERPPASCAAIVLIEPEPALEQAVRELGFVPRVLAADEAARHRWTDDPGRVIACVMPQKLSPLIGALRSQGLGAPILVTASQRSFEQRLLALRDGADAVIGIPPDRDEIQAILESLLAPVVDAKVLVIDDDRVALALTAAHLRHAGFAVETLRDPRAALEAISAFRPDMLVLDLEMPTCSGIELARLIRSEPALIGLPIVFLSGAADPDNRLAALAAGADGFMIKPVDGPLLVRQLRAVGARISRLDTLASRDGLTGHLNAKAVRRELKRAVALGGRDGVGFSVALIDVDHFKRVNDTYGHPVGDLVLRRLAARLRAALRDSDVIGRLGGEEFLIMLPAADLPDAVARIDAIRRSFAAEIMAEPEGDRLIRVTFSAGVAEWTHGEGAAELLQRVDAALYHAKHGGRDQVAASTPAGAEAVAAPARWLGRLRANVGSLLFGAAAADR